MQREAVGFVFTYPPIFSCTLRHDLNNPNFEILWVEISLQSKRSLLFGCCCRPPHCDQSFYEYLEATLENVAGQDILLTGYFNAKHTEWYSGDTVNSHGIAMIMKDLSDRFNLTQLCSKPTHLNLAGKPESLLDLVLTNTPEYFHESARPMPPIGSSDHLPVVAKYQSIYYYKI